MLRSRALPWLACLALVTGVACAPSRGLQPDPLVASQPDPPPVPGAEVREGSLHNGFITVRAVLPPGATDRVPAVLTLFGEEESLLALGLAVVSFQIHWELLRPPAAARQGTAPPPEEPAPRTWGKWMLASPSPHTVGEGYLKLIAGNATGTIPQVLDWVATVPEIDGERIGVAGFSTNGFTALQAAAADSRIVAAAAFAACGDYHAFLERSPLGLGGEEPFTPTPAYEAFLVEQEPIRHPERLLHAAVLMVNGDADHAVPVACAEDTARVLAAAYAAAGVPERFRYVEVPGGTHDLGPEGRWQALAWFQRWLLGPEAAKLVDVGG